MENKRDNNLNIGMVNQRELARKKRRKIQRRNRFVAFVAGVGLVGAIATGVHGIHKKSEPPLVMPEDCIQIYVSDNVERGDTLTEIACRYYDEETYECYYGSLNNYIEAIADTNNINKDRITPYQSLSIPVFVDEDNIYLQQIANLEAQIAELPKWVPYTVKYGDTVLGLAYLGAGNTNEAYAIKDDIMARNGFKNSFMVAGNEIEIVNPEIGKLKTEIIKLRELLHQSVQIEQPEEEKTY